MAIEDHMTSPDNVSEREWLTWRQVCKQLEALGIHPNSEKAKPLMAAIKLWGEELHMLNAAPDTDPDYVRNERNRQRRKYYSEFLIDGGAP